MKLRAHQEEATAAILNHLKKGPRAQLLMACGTGKTLVGVETHSRLGARRTVIFVPSLSLISQNLEVWAASIPDLRYLAVCCDETVDREVRGDSLAKVTTTLEEVEKHLKRPGVVFCTYRSAHLLEGQKFDLGVFDEAHKTAGPEGAEASFALDEAKVQIRRRLFMTATPRLSRSGASMDDEKIYGPVAYRLPFSEAVRRDLVCDYRIVLMGVRGKDFQGETPDPVRIGEIAVRKAMAKYGIKKMITYHNTVAAAEAMAERLEAVGTPAFSFNGTQSAGFRSAQIEKFRAIDTAVATNARCLTEGVDIPEVDAVFFLSPKESVVDNTQAVGRASRKRPGKTKGYVILPIYVPVDSRESDEEIVASSRYAHVWHVISALHDLDDVLAAKVASRARSIEGSGFGVDVGDGDMGIEIDDLDVSVENLELIVVDRLSSTFDKRLGEARAWRIKHGRKPSKNAAKDEEERRIATWENNCRTTRAGYGRGGAITEERVKALEALPWGFHWYTSRGEREVHAQMTMEEWSRVEGVLDSSVTNTEIAKLTGANPTRIGKVRRALGVRPPRSKTRGWSREQWLTVPHIMDPSISTEAVARHLGVSGDVVAKARSLLGFQANDYTTIDGFFNPKIANTEVARRATKVGVKVTHHGIRAARIKAGVVTDKAAILDAIAAMSKKRRKPVVRVVIASGERIVYGAKKELTDAGWAPTTIRRVCGSKTRVHNGSIWFYESDEQKVNVPKLLRQARRAVEPRRS
jgi:superfamily II DNA or RNA helicase